MPRKKKSEFQMLGELCDVEMPAPSYPVISDDLRVQREYENLRFAGESHNIAEMIATRRVPGIKTDSTFKIGHCNGNQFADNPAMGEHYRRLAIEAGVDPTGKIYKHSLADYAGDPSAWVSSRGDVERVCAAKGFNCDGAVSYRCGEREAPPDIEIGDDIIKDDVDAIMELDPSQRREDVVERVRDIRTGKVDLHPELHVKDQTQDWGQPA